MPMKRSGRSVDAASRVIEIDVRQHRDVRVNDVGRVPRTPHTYFDDAYVNPLVREVQQRRHREQLETRQHDPRHRFDVRESFEHADQ